MPRVSTYLITALFLAALIAGCAGSPAPTTVPNPTAVATQAPTPQSTTAPTPTPIPTPSFTDARAEETARKWVADNEGLVRTEIGRTMTTQSDSLVEVSAGMKGQVASAGQAWEGGQVDSKIVWTGVRFVLPPGDEGRWELTLTSESVTDLEHEGIEGQLKAVIPFKFYGVYEEVEGYEVQLDEVALSLEGITANIDLDQKLLDKEGVDSAIEGLLGN